MKESNFYALYVDVRCSTEGLEGSDGTIKLVLTDKEDNVEVVQLSSGQAKWLGAKLKQAVKFVKE